MLNLQLMDRPALEKMLSTTKERFESYTSMKKSHEEINEVYLQLKKLQTEMNRRLTGRMGY